MSDRPRSLDRRGNRIRLIAALVVLFLILLPVVVVAQRGYFGSVPAVSRQYKPWVTSAHAEVGCPQCHVGPRVLPQVAYNVRMVGEFYLTLLMRSRTPDVFARPSNAACLECHNDLRSVSPKGDLQIPHRAHISILKMDCVDCHGYLVHEFNPSGKHVPTMADCLRCHDGDTAKDTCTACHTDKAAPDTHRSADWLVSHPAKATSPDCDSCHKWTEDWCADCHARRPRSHGKDWREVHGERTKVHRSCEACHPGDFCIRCHGEVPKENFDPSLKLVE